MSEVSIDDLLRLVLAEAQKDLPAQEIAEMTELVDHGEPGIALENLCTQLYEYDIPVSRPMLASIVEAGGRMGIRDSYWTILDVTDDVVGEG